MKLDFLSEIYRDYPVTLSAVPRTVSSMKIRNNFLNFLGEDIFTMDPRENAHQPLLHQRSLLLESQEKKRQFEHLFLTQLIALIHWVFYKKFLEKDFSLLDKGKSSSRMK